MSNRLYVEFWKSRQIIWFPFICRTVYMSRICQSKNLQSTEKLECTKKRKNPAPKAMKKFQGNYFPKFPFICRTVYMSNSQRSREISVYMSRHINGNLLYSRQGQKVPGDTALRVTIPNTDGEQHQGVCLFCGRMPHLTAPGRQKSS